MNLCVVARQASVGLFLNEAADDAVEVMLRVVSEIERDCDRLSHDCLKVQSAVFRNHLQIEPKESRDIFLAPERSQQQLVRPQRSRNLQLQIVLYVNCAHLTLTFLVVASACIQPSRYASIDFCRPRCCAPNASSSARVMT